MEKYKICPSCGTKNDPILIECLNCEADLTQIKITDEDTEKMLKANKPHDSINAERLVRICDCGTKNLPNARKCSSCHEDISDIVPTLDNEDIGQHEKYVLSSIDGKYAFTFTAPETIVGREKSMSEYLCSKPYVSRSHAKITIEKDKLYIENLSGTNHTFINNTMIIKKTQLNVGDIVGLGGININGKYQDKAAHFYVRIVSCM